MTDTIKVEIRLALEVSSSDGKTSLLKVKTIKRMDDVIAYAFPEDFQAIQHHSDLQKLSVVKNASKSLQRRNQFRNIKLTFTPDLIPKYLDTDGNFVFGEFYLEEVDNGTTILAGQQTVASEVHQVSEKNLGKIASSIMMQKFKGKGQNVITWVQQFENECSKYQVIDINDKIKLFSTFLEENASEWYISTYYKLDQTSTWEHWKSSFIETFIDRGWTGYRNSFNYKYLGGSLVDYTLKKERLLLEVDSSIPLNVRIPLIVLGFPDSIQNRLDREEVITIEKLINTLRMIDVPNNNNNNAKKKTAGSTKNSNMKPQDNSEQKSCEICEINGKPRRFHPVSSCWFSKNSKIGEIKSVNQTEMEDSLNREVTDQKN